MSTLSIRQMVAAVLLVIFTLANYAVQTHVHGNPVSQSPAAFTQIAAAPSTGSPADRDEQSCPLCQEFVSGGNFLVPAPLIVFPILLVSDTVLTAFAYVGQHSRSHSWQGRGPPSV